MKLINSRQEKEFEKELRKSNATIRNGTCSSRLLGALKANETDLTRLFVLNWVPEQAEDLYAIFVPPNEVLEIEVPRYTGPVKVVRLQLSEYVKGSSKTQRRKVAVAQSLASSTEPVRE